MTLNSDHELVERLAKCMAASADECMTLDAAVNATGWADESEAGQTEWRNAAWVCLLVLRKAGWVSASENTP